MLPTQRQHCESEQTLWQVFTQYHKCLRARMPFSFLVDNAPNTALRAKTHLANNRAQRMCATQWTMHLSWSLAKSAVAVLRRETKVSTETPLHCMPVCIPYSPCIPLFVVYIHVYVYMCIQCIQFIHFTACRCASHTQPGC